MSNTLIEKSLANKVVMVGVTYRTDKPNGGGVSSVVDAYSRYFDGLRYIATWKQTNKLNKLLFFFWGYIRLFILLCFDKRIKIIHIHAASDASFERKMMIFNLSKLFRKKVILHMHAGEFDRYYCESHRQDSIRKTILKADKLIALSKSWADYYIKFGKNEKDVILLNNMIASAEKNVTKVSEDHVKLRMLYLGWLGEKKGVFDLLDTIVIHKEELKGKFHLKLGGFDNYDRINNIITENQIEDLVSLEGWVSGEKKKECLEWANVFVLPSYYEGLPISILEAMSYGMPIISTPVGGIPEVVKDHENGVMVTPGDKEQIWNAIKLFIDHPEKVQQYSKRSLEFVKPYTPEVVMTDLKRIYTELLNEA